MPSGKDESAWFRPISEWKGGTLSSTAAPVTTASPIPGTQRPPVLQQGPQQGPNQMVQSELEGGTMDILSLTIHSLNTNPYFIGMLMLLLNLGGRFLSMELTKKQEEFLQQRWLRPLIFFTVIFVATRNLAVAFWMTLALFLILWILANEKSPFCIIPSWRAVQENMEGKEKLYETNMNLIQGVAPLGAAPLGAAPP